MEREDWCIRKDCPHEDGAICPDVRVIELRELVMAYKREARTNIQARDEGRREGLREAALWFSGQSMLPPDARLVDNYPAVVAKLEALAAEPHEPASIAESGRSGGDAREPEEKSDA